MPEIIDYEDGSFSIYYGNDKRQMTRKQKETYEKIVIALKATKSKKEGKSYANKRSK